MRRPTPRRWQDDPMPRVPVDRDALTKRESERLQDRAILVVCLAVFVALILLGALRGCNADAQDGSGVAPRGRDVHAIRLAKARVIVQDLYPDSGMYAWLGTLIREHEAYGDEDFAGTYYWSLVYGGANFSLRVGATAPGYCSGPLDVKMGNARDHRRMRTDTAAHIRHHVAEMWLGYRKGYRGRRLCEYVFLPSRPRDWGGGKFRQADASHRACIERAHREAR